jgi:hypothetical protein
MSKMFPFKTTYSIDDEVRRHVRARLPQREIAWGLAHQYYGHIAWSYVFCSICMYRTLSPVAEPTLCTGQSFLITPCTQFTVTTNQGTSKLVRFICNVERWPCTNRVLALVFAVLALGTALDLKKQPFDPQALEYVDLARVSLMLGEDILQSRSFVVIQTLVSQRFPALGLDAHMLIRSLYVSISLHSIINSPTIRLDRPSHGC